MRRSVILVAGVLAFVTLAVAAESTRPALRVRIPETVARGEVLRILVEGEQITDVRATLQLSGRAELSVPGFPVASGPTGFARWQALAGINHVAAGGTAVIEVVVRTVAGERRFHDTFLVEERAFPQEDIALNTFLSDLRQTEDPRRTQESRELWGLLHRVDRDARYHSGAFRSPLATYRRTSTFGDRRVFIYSDGQIARTWHNGLDMAAPTGTPVYAPARGRVVMAADRIITGGSVVIEHQPGLYSIYYHLHRIDVSEGVIVAQGEQIGTVGATGLATGPHLHWEVRVGGIAVDPEWFIGAPLVDTGGMAGALSTIP